MYQRTTTKLNRKSIDLIKYNFITYNYRIDYSF